MITDYPLVAAHCRDGLTVLERAGVWRGEPFRLLHVGENYVVWLESGAHPAFFEAAMKNLLAQVLGK